MASTDDLIDTGLAVSVIRYFKDWTQADLSDESGVDQGLISQYEQGKVRSGPKNRGCLAKAVGADLEWFEQLVAHCRGIRQHFERIGREGRSGASGDAAAAPDLQGKILEAVREGVAPYLLQLSQPEREPEPQPEDRAWAEEQWLIMEPLGAELQHAYVEILEGDERSWAVAEKLCRVSEAVAAERPDEALRLARLAVQLAEQSPGSESWRRRLRRWCEHFVVHASGGPGRPNLKEPLLL
jgi:transcriptional regulator with XRE-family HTH domain